MLGLLASASLGFSSLPEPVCVCGNYPLYMTMDEAGTGGHSMCFFGTTMWMPMGGTMSGGTMDYTCPSDMAVMDMGMCDMMNDAGCDDGNMDTMHGDMDMGR